MITVQAIEHRGRVVAFVAGERALIDDALAGTSLALVRAKCLYALEIQAGARPGPYTDEAAARYARRVLRQDGAGRALTRRPR